MLVRLWHDLWIGLFLALIVVGVFAGHGLLIGFSVMGLLVAGVSWLWNRVALEDVAYERSLSQNRVFMGEEVTLTVAVTNGKPVPLARLSALDTIPLEVEVLDAETSGSSSPNAQTLRHLTSMAWYERIRWEYKVKSGHRGLHILGPAQVESGDLFGFFSSEKSFSERDYLLVYPTVAPLAELGFPASRPLGDVGGGNRMFEDASRPFGLREYRLGDPMKTVDWKATARMQQLQVRTFEPSASNTVVLVVDVDTTAHYWEGYSAANLERITVAGASVASYAAEQGYSLGLFSNGTPMLADRPMKITPSQSPDQLTIILEALATIRPMAMGQMWTQLAQNSRQFPLGATLVLVTAFFQPEMAEVVRTLKSRGYRLVVAHVGDGEWPEMPEGVIVHELRAYFEGIEYAGSFAPR